jgi:hypothetical protein
MMLAAYPGADPLPSVIVICWKWRLDQPCRNQFAHPRNDLDSRSSTSSKSIYRVDQLLVSSRVRSRMACMALTDRNVNTYVFQVPRSPS